jgi:autoinducer 2-degrading protein
MTQEPLTRVVKLTLDPQYIADFKQVFSRHQQHIAQMKGCLSLQAFQDNKEPHIFFTISHWENEHALDNYRYSEFFKNLWATVKPMFTAKAMAHSLNTIQ